MDFSIIGLSIRDKRVYEALLAIPNSSLRAIAETTNINRGSVYESIKSLRAAGLVNSVTKGKQLRYRAEDPAILAEILREKQQALQVAGQQLDQYIVRLRTANKITETRHMAAFYEGDEGLANILRDILSTCRLQKINLYRVISSPRVSRYLYNNFPNFSRERAKRNLRVRVLRYAKPLRITTGLADSRYLAGPKLDDGCYTILYVSKMAIITLDKYNSMHGVIIDNASLVSVQTRLFDIAWQGASEG